MEQDKFLIVFEGIDNSGKTTISKIIHKRLLEDDMVVNLVAAKNSSDITPNDSGLWNWSKEPQFSTGEADRLNSANSPMNEYGREALFLASRVKNQKVYKEASTVLDRYLWTGMAYAKVFSPACFKFCTELYGNSGLGIFKKPDLTIFIDAPVAECQAREPALSVKQLSAIREAYMGTKKYVPGEVATIANLDGKLEETIEAVWNIIVAKFFGEKSDRMQNPIPFPASIKDLTSIRAAASEEKDEREDTQQYLE